MSILYTLNRCFWVVCQHWEEQMGEVYPSESFRLHYLEILRCDSPYSWWCHMIEAWILDNKDTSPNNHEHVFGQYIPIEIKIRRCLVNSPETNTQFSLRYVVTMIHPAFTFHVLVASLSLQASLNVRHVVQGEMGTWQTVRHPNSLQKKKKRFDHFLV